MDIRERISQHGTTYTDRKNGNSLLHEAVDTTPSTVFVCANAGVHVNAQNFAGDTALHLAVRRRNRGTARAILMCGADLSIRNKLGQTPVSEAPGSMADLLHLYRPGLVTAVTRGDNVAMSRLVKNWCNVNSRIKDGKSALDLLLERSSMDTGVCSCYNTIKDHQDTLELVHAVMAEDVERLQTILNTSRKWNVNVRYRNQRGMTPLSCALNQNNLDLTRLLLGTGSCRVNIRVRENEDAEQTIPLYFLCLGQTCPTDLWTLLVGHVDTQQHSERDPEGNTAIFRALLQGRSSSFIECLIKHRQGRNITDRNLLGETVRDVAESIGRSDVLDLIDQYIIENTDRGFLMNLPVNFYGADKLLIRNKDGENVEQLARVGKNQQGIQTMVNYDAIEKQGLRLFKASVAGDVPSVAKLNDALYRDKNGLTALILAIVFNRLPVVEMLLTGRPQLRLVADNANRYPLHYAYALPQELSRPMVKALLSKNPDEIEHRVDKDGRHAAAYSDLRSSPEVVTMLNDVWASDVYGQVAPPGGLGIHPGDVETLLTLSEAGQTES